MGIRQLVKLSAYLLSDGGVSPRGKTSYTIFFRNMDPLLLKHFQVLLEECAQKKGYNIKRKDGTGFIKLYSRELADELFKLSRSYRTKACRNYPVCMHIKGKRSPHRGKTIRVEGVEYPPASLPMKHLMEDKQLARDFLKIFMSCDGGISVVPARNGKGSLFLVRKVFIEVKHPALKQQLQKILQMIGYKPKVYETQIRLTTKEDLEKFNNEIGFVKGAKITNASKYLAGFKKNKILRMVIDSYNDPRYLLSFLLEKRSLF